MFVVVDHKGQEKSLSGGDRTDAMFVFVCVRVRVYVCIIRKDGVASRHSISHSLKFVACWPNAAV